jgi:hypothetical protein
MNDTAKYAAAPPRGPLGIAGHALLPLIQGEVHARPFQLLETPRTIVQLAFLIEPGALAAQGGRLGGWGGGGAAPPPPWPPPHLVFCGVLGGVGVFFKP